MHLDLFDFQNSTLRKQGAPLAERMRPEAISEYVGQEHLLGKEGPLQAWIRTDQIPSMILWGPPGVGKTTLAHLIAKATSRNFYFFSAVLAGLKEVREVIEKAQAEFKFHQRKSILFVDEIHRFNKAQQDAFLPHVEKGTIALIGATTENPSFEVIGPLLSRAQVFLLQPLSRESLEALLARALNDAEKGLGALRLSLEEQAKNFLVEFAQGDARKLLNSLEMVASLAEEGPQAGSVLSLGLVQRALQKKALQYDKSGEEHYNLISAFIKSMRGSDPDAAVYWLARMLEAGEDPLFIVRRMVIFASEDIGNADPSALPLAIAAMQAFDFVGMPEGWIPLSQAALYLACASKSKASYKAYLRAKEDVEQYGALPTPLFLRNAPTELMRQIGYGKGYKSPHEVPSGEILDQDYLPATLSEHVYYEPTENGEEKKLKDALEKQRLAKKKSSPA